VLAERSVRPGREVLQLEGAPDERVPVTLAGIIQALRWRTRAGGGRDDRFLTVDVSDRGGSWSARVFDAAVQDALHAAAETQAPLLFHVELRFRDGSPEPGVTIRAVQPLEALNASARARLTVRLEPDAGPDAATHLFLHLERDGRSEVVVEVPTASGLARIRLGQDFRLRPALDADLQMHPAIASAEIAALGPPLRLVA
jgi:hypothetical protein